jgi:iron complex transport system substrate-binding protein
MHEKVGNIAMRTPSTPCAGATAGARTWSRRNLLALSGGLTAGAALGQPARARQATPASSPVAGEWTFTDDAGTTVTLPERPVRIVADLNAATALWDFGIAPVAVSGYTVTTDAAWGNLDRSIPSINAGPETGAPDLEALLAMEPDLFVTITWSPENPDIAYEWTFPDPAELALAQSIVPVVAISATGLADVNTARFAELAGLLGADLESPELVAARAAYDDAVAAFRTLAEEKSDLTTLFVYAAGDNEYVANPSKWADLAMYQALGLNIIEPDVPETEYWHQLSPEQALIYPSDVLFQSTRTEILSLEELAAHPTYGMLPAVASGQFGAWNQDFIMSYQGLTAAFETMLPVLQDATKVT